MRRLALIVWAACSQSDVNHVTGDVNFLGLLMRRSRTLLTITDSASMQRLVGWKRWFYRTFWIRLPIWRAGHVVVISEATLHETLSYVRSDYAKFSVIPCCTPRGYQLNHSPSLTVVRVSSRWAPSPTRICLASSRRWRGCRVGWSSSGHSRNHSRNSSLAKVAVSAANAYCAAGPGRSWQHRSRVTMERLRSILVFRIGQLGDTLVSLPAISVIRQQHPDHRLVLLTERQPVASGYVSSWDVLGPTGWFDDVIFYVPEQNLGRRVLTMLSLAKRVRALQPAMVYNLAPKRTGRQDRRDRFFFRRLAGVKEYRGGGFFLMPPKNSQDMLPRVEPEWKRLLRVIGAKTGNTNYRLFIPVTEQEHARKLLLREGLGNGTRMLAIGPGSKMTAKMWGRDRYRELGQRLLRVYPELHLAVVGGKEDAAAGEELCAVWGHRSHNLAGRLSVYGSAAALQQCIAYIGNDAGAMHLAGMMGISCVALFSARDYPGQWEPYGTNHVILRHETECAGCMRTVCPYNNKCLSLISIDEAEHALRRVLSSETILERSGEKIGGNSGSGTGAAYSRQNATLSK